MLDLGTVVEAVDEVSRVMQKIQTNVGLLGGILSKIEADWKRLRELEMLENQRGDKKFG